MNPILVVIPTIRGREEMATRAAASVMQQTGNVQPMPLLTLDERGEGPAEVRNRGVATGMKTGEYQWIAFLDDDDTFKPEHLSACLMHAQATGADVVYPWFDLMRGGVLRNDFKFLFQDLGPGDRVDAFERPFNAEALRKNNYIPVTALVRTEKFLEVGGFPEPNSEAWPHKDCEDWGLWLRLLDAGAKFEHLPQRSWTWWHHGRNTSGRPDLARKIYGGES